MTFQQVAGVFHEVVFVTKEPTLNQATALARAFVNKDSSNIQEMRSRTWLGHLIGDETTGESNREEPVARFIIELEILVLIAPAPWTDAPDRKIMENAQDGGIDDLFFSIAADGLVELRNASRYDGDSNFPDHIVTRTAGTITKWRHGHYFTADPSDIARPSPDHKPGANVPIAVALGNAIKDGELMMILLVEVG
ncbi:hypothetical protein N7528_007536 [Penicillium herquei]|nr:hypothetical protein N7528_007536 [Penicillium herquei]